MATFGIHEIYGYPISVSSEEAVHNRRNELCPFKGGKCSKKGGVCTITDGSTSPIVCPQRFKQGGTVYREIAKLAFEPGREYAVLSEIPFLQPISSDNTGQHVGNIDNVIVSFDEEGRIADWCAIEVQAVYFSGKSMASESKAFLESGLLKEPGQRRPDFRSSGPKRLLPQLETKVPTLRRWGKKMFVAVDAPFMDWLPDLKEENDISNCDICWLAFGMSSATLPHRLKLDRRTFTTLEESRRGLVAGQAPPLTEFEGRIATALERPEKVIFQSNKTS